MNQNIHKTAIIEDGAIIGDDVIIGPYSIIGANVTIRNNVTIHSHVVIQGNTFIDSGCKIFPFASIGQDPQDLKFKGENAKVTIGKNNTIREYVTIQKGTEDGIMNTIIGDNCLFMVGVHIAHDCIIGNNVIMANYVSIAGHVEVEDNVVIGGLSACRQKVKIGKNAMIGGLSGITKDVCPYFTVHSVDPKLEGVNIIGLKRKGVDAKTIQNIIKAQKLLFSSEDNLSNNITKAQNAFNDIEQVEEIINFIQEKSKNGVYRFED